MQMQDRVLTNGFDPMQLQDRALTNAPNPLLP